jgi:hypothetical protein
LPGKWIDGKDCSYYNHDQGRYKSARGHKIQSQACPGHPHKYKHDHGRDDQRAVFLTFGKGIRGVVFETKCSPPKEFIGTACSMKGRGRIAKPAYRGQGFYEK